MPICQTVAQEAPADFAGAFQLPGVVSAQWLTVQFQIPESVNHTIPSLSVEIQSHPTMYTASDLGSIRARR